MTLPASREDVFAVLSDGWLFAAWVVGASHIRKVDPGWPAKGSRIHHSVGAWPLHVQDTTEVLDVDPLRLLELEARAWPFGVARVRLELTETGPKATDVVMYEEAVRGPGKVVPQSWQALLLVPRNRESLRRLADLAVGKAA
ncbi:MAG: SRPBCC family protein [Kibdelosporangium sp.]